MTKRYFKADLGKITVFRASETRVYQSASEGRYGIGFSAKPASIGTSPAVEITKAEYDQLTQLKQARTDAKGTSRSFTSPQDSWVDNEAIAEALS